MNELIDQIPNWATTSLIATLPVREGGRPALALPARFQSPATQSGFQPPPPHLPVREGGRPALALAARFQSPATRSDFNRPHP